jgi:hypothetical protein
MSATTSNEEAFFQESQSFRQPWMWGLMLAVAVVMAAGLAVGLASGPQGAEGVVVQAAVVLVWALLCLFLYALRLSVRVDRHYLHVRFFPLLRRDIPLEDVAHWEARTYRPLLEYGGWGIRWSWWKGTAYNVRGNRGVQLELTSGKRLLIGSQKAEELADALGRAKCTGPRP